MPALRLPLRAATSLATAVIGLAGPATGHGGAAAKTVRFGEQRLPRVTAVFAPAERAPAPALVFPVAGPHRIGTEAAQRFGGARGHMGQDVFAKCGTPIVAAAGGTVVRSEYEAAGGNYLVVEAPDRRGNVYMHMLRPARFSEGDAITAGEPLGRVGQSGDADGCHLHFEQWTAPGWFAGVAVDPYRELAAAAAAPEPILGRARPELG